MNLTTTTGNTVILEGFNVTIKGITFEVRKSATGLKSAMMVKTPAGTCFIDLAFTGGDLASAHAHLDAAAAAVAAAHKVNFAAENSSDALAAKMYARNSDI